VCAYACACVFVCVYIFTYIEIPAYPERRYGVATICRLLKIIGLFYRISSLL